MGALMHDTLESPCPIAAGAAVGFRCAGCGSCLREVSTCSGCGQEHPWINGILHAVGTLTGTNRIAAAFYDGPTWPKFRFWEEVFLWCQGPGIAPARRQVLRHLPRASKLRVLEVGIGDGQNLKLLPVDWEIFGVDVALSRLETCRGRFPRISGRLAWAEAERLPFEDATFDAVFTVGGINYFRDPFAALSEMRRVARPGAVLVAADERPDLFRYNLGHALGLEAIDQWLLRRFGLPDEFVRMVYEAPARVEDAATEVWPRHERFPIWSRLGYCLVDTRNE
jgi:SAM-dependent methyltransferase